jgi:hypothetical protein
MTNEEFPNDEFHGSGQWPGSKGQEEELRGEGCECYRCFDCAISL